MTPHREHLITLIDSCEYIDAHVHCDSYSDGDVLAHSLNTHKILCLSSGTSPDSWKKNAALSEKTPWIVPCIGIHPWEAGQYSAEDIFLNRSRYSSAPMISEIGLDTVWAEPDASLARQRPLLEMQLRLAVENRRPVTLHTKGAEHQILELLSSYTPPGILIHWYDGPRELLKGFLDRGCFFTIPLPILNNTEYRELIMSIPQERLLPETDNPSSWPWLFQQPGSPEQIRKVYEEYTGMVGKDKTIIHNQFKENMKALLQLEPLRQEG
jgi:TatD DNase family protein